MIWSSQSLACCGFVTVFQITGEAITKFFPILLISFSDDDNFVTLQILTHDIIKWA